MKKDRPSGRDQSNSSSPIIQECDRTGNPISETTPKKLNRTMTDEERKRIGNSSLNLKDSIKDYLTYICFFILGSSFLLPWNTIIVSSVYFGSRLKGSRFESNFLNVITLLYTSLSVIFLSRATWTQINSNPEKRIKNSLVLIIVSFSLLLASTNLSKVELDQSNFFKFLILITIGTSLGSSYLQASCFGLSSKFGSDCLQAILSGQGAIAVLISSIQLIASTRSLKRSAADQTSEGSELFRVTVESGDEDPEDEFEKIRKSSFTFYLVATMFSVFALACFLILTNSNHYKSKISLEREFRPLLPSLGEEEEEEGEGEGEGGEGEGIGDLNERGDSRKVTRKETQTLIPIPIQTTTASSSLVEVERRPLMIGSEEEEEDDDDDEGFKGADDEKVSLRRVESKVRVLGLSVMMDFTITLSVFPSITGFIVPYRTPRPGLNSIDPRELIVEGGGSEFLRIINDWFRNPMIFIQLHFLIFNLGDWLGRVLPQFKSFGLNRFLVRRPRTILSLTLSRIIFVMMLVVCNFEKSRFVLVKNDFIYIFILILFSISNGYLSTLAMISGISETNLKLDEIDVAGTCLSFYLSLGLSIGSFLSFGVKALI